MVFFFFCCAVLLQPVVVRQKKHVSPKNNLRRHKNIKDKKMEGDRGAGGSGSTTEEGKGDEHVSALHVILRPLKNAAGGQETPLTTPETMNTVFDLIKSFLGFSEFSRISGWCKYARHKVHFSVGGGGGGGGGGGTSGGVVNFLRKNQKVAVQALQDMTWSHGERMYNLTPAPGILLCGPAGGGKSTTVLFWLFERHGPVASVKSTVGRPRWPVDRDAWTECQAAGQIVGLVLPIVNNLCAALGLTSAGLYSIVSPGGVHKLNMDFDSIISCMKYLEQVVDNNAPTLLEARGLRQYLTNAFVAVAHRLVRTSRVQNKVAVPVSIPVGATLWVVFDSRDILRLGARLSPSQRSMVYAYGYGNLCEIGHAELGQNPPGLTKETDPHVLGQFVVVIITVDHLAKLHAKDTAAGAAACKDVQETQVTPLDAINRMQFRAMVMDFPPRKLLLRDTGAARALVDAADHIQTVVCVAENKAVVGDLYLPLGRGAAVVAVLLRLLREHHAAAAAAALALLLGFEGHADKPRTPEVDLRVICGTPLSKRTPIDDLYGLVQQGIDGVSIVMDGQPKTHEDALEEVDIPVGLFKEWGKLEQKISKRKEENRREEADQQKRHFNEVNIIRQRQDAEKKATEATDKKQKSKALKQRDKHVQELKCQQGDIATFAAVMATNRECIAGDKDEQRQIVARLLPYAGEFVERVNELQQPHADAQARVLVITQDRYQTSVVAHVLKNGVQPRSLVRWLRFEADKIDWDGIPRMTRRCNVCGTLNHVIIGQDATGCHQLQAAVVYFKQSPDRALGACVGPCLCDQFGCTVSSAAYPRATEAQAHLPETFKQAQPCKGHPNPLYRVTLEPPNDVCLVKPAEDLEGYSSDSDAPEVGTTVTIKEKPAQYGSRCGDWQFHGLHAWTAEVLKVRPCGGLHAETANNWHGDRSMRGVDPCPVHLPATVMVASEDAVMDMAWRDATAVVFVGTFAKDREEELLGRVRNGYAERRPLHVVRTKVPNCPKTK